MAFIHRNYDTSPVYDTLADLLEFKVCKVIKNKEQGVKSKELKVETLKSL